VTALLNDARLTPGGRALNTFRTHARALGASDPLAPGATRFLVDFSGGDLSYYLSDPTMVEVIATTSAGKITRSFLAPNSHVSGFRAGIDVQIDPGQSCDLRVFLKSANHALTETWTFPWRA
jgi:glucans biosynthesis protein